MNLSIRENLNIIKSWIIYTITLLTVLWFLPLNKKRNSWDIFYLGAVSDVRKKGTNRLASFPGIYKMVGICTHAYVVNFRAMKKLKDISYTGIHIDFFLRDNFRCYAIYPSLFYQGGFSSDITKGMDSHSFLNSDMVNLWFKLTETYAYYVGISVRRMGFLIFFIIGWYILRFNKKVHFFIFIAIIFMLLLNFTE